MTFIEDLANLDAQQENRPKFTTIVKIGITPEGQYCVGRNPDNIDGWLNKNQILDAIPNINFAPVTSADPFFFSVYGWQRLVFTLAPDAWFYQQTVAPFVLTTPDPYKNFKDVVLLDDDPYSRGRSKTLYLTDDNKKGGPELFHYDLMIDIWQAPGSVDSARTQTVIDPGLKNDQEPE